jgi:hypothetical protein
MVNRHLFHIEIQNQPFPLEEVELIRKRLMKDYHLEAAQTPYFVFTGEVANHAYDPHFDRINIIGKNGITTDITEASDQLNIDILSRTVKKYFLCCPKDVYSS